jgi:hypothetical protein
MAVPRSPEEVESNDDLAKLSLAQSYFTMSESAAWKDLMGRIQGLVDQAQQELFSSRATDSATIIEEKLRWQQRVLLRQSVLQIVQGQLDTREAILEEMKGIDEHRTDNAE